MTDDNHINYVNPNALSQIDWVRVGVRVGRSHRTDLKRMPLDIQDMEIVSIYAGDVIAIAPSVRYQDYVMARIGVQVGWVSLRDVKLIPMRMSKRSSITDTKPSVPPYEQVRPAGIIDEDETEPAVPTDERFSNIRDSYLKSSSPQAKVTATSRQNPTIKTSHIRRLIGYMKGIVSLNKDSS